MSLRKVTCLFPAPVHGGRLLSSRVWCQQRYRSDHISHIGKSTDSELYQHRSAKVQSPSGLQRLPTWNVLRNLILGVIFSTKLFNVGLPILQHISASKNRLLNPDTNPLIRALVKPLIYDQFCAGTNKSEIFHARDTIKGIGYAGVILCYGKEIQISKDNSIHSTGQGHEDQVLEVNQWRNGNLETLDMVAEGDWLGIKLTGAGPGVTQALMQGQEASSHFTEAMDAICERALSKGCRIWIDAEQQVLQKTIDLWTIDMMRKYNRNGKALIYNTVQAYLKASRDKLKHQLALAKKEDWTLAVKLVRGAYIANDQRELIHDTKTDTDNSYNGIVRDVVSGRNLGFKPEDFPSMQLFIAGHNARSVAQAWAQVQELSKRGELKVLPDFGQLQGMADELGCEFLERGDELRRTAQSTSGSSVVVPQLYKCLTWGSIQECMQYLIRRAVENQGGAERMADSLSANYAELKRRMFGRFSTRRE